LAEGKEWEKRKDILTYEENIRIVKVMAKLGVKNIKVTGGEPLLRKGMPHFIQQLKNISGIQSVTLATNGILLGAYLDEHNKSGCVLPDEISIKLDAIDNNIFKRITRFEDTKNNNMRTETILKYIDQLLEKNIIVKINFVPIRSINEKEIIKIAAIAKDKNIIVRFIDMTFDAASPYKSVSGPQTAALVEKTYGPLIRFNSIMEAGQSVYYTLEGFKGKIGFINAVNHGFCETCNRMRLTSDGLLKPCISNNSSLNLRKLMRSGNNDDELIKYIKEIVEKKPGFQSLSRIYGTPKSYPAYYPTITKAGGSI